jgi:hypothetical protein
LNFLVSEKIQTLIEHQRRNLEAQRLPRAGWHDGEAVASVNNRRDYFLLPRPEAPISKICFQQLDGLRAHAITKFILPCPRAKYNGAGHIFGEFRPVGVNSVFIAACFSNFQLAMFLRLILEADLIVIGIADPRSFRYPYNF